MSIKSLLARCYNEKHQPRHAQLRTRRRHLLMEKPQGRELFAANLTDGILEIQGSDKSDRLAWPAEAFCLASRPIKPFSFQ